MLQDENDQPIQRHGPRNAPAGMPDCSVVLVGGAANLVTLEANKVYRVISDVGFHFALGIATEVATANDEMQPANLPMFITTDNNHRFLSVIGPYGDGTLWIGEWE